MAKAKRTKKPPDFKAWMKSLPTDRLFAVTLEFFKNMGFDPWRLKNSDHFGCAAGYPWLVSLIIRNGSKASVLKTKEFNTRLDEIDRRVVGIPEEAMVLLPRLMESSRVQEIIAQGGGDPGLTSAIRNSVLALLTPGAVVALMYIRMQKIRNDKLFEPLYEYAPKFGKKTVKPLIKKIPIKGSFSKDFTGDAQYILYEISQLFKYMCRIAEPYIMGRGLEGVILDKDPAKNEVLLDYVSPRIKTLMMDILPKAFRIMAVMKCIYDLHFAMQLHSKTNKFTEAELLELINACECDGEYYLKLRDLDIVKYQYHLETGLATQMREEMTSDIKFYNDRLKFQKDASKSPGAAKHGDPAKSPVPGYIAVEKPMVDMVASFLKDFNLPAEQVAMLAGHAEGKSYRQIAAELKKSMGMTLNPKKVERTIKAIRDTLSPHFFPGDDQKGEADMSGPC